MNGDAYCEFLERSLLPKLLLFNGVNPRSVVFLDNASIPHAHSECWSTCTLSTSLLSGSESYRGPLLKGKSVFKENDYAIQWIGEDCTVDIVQAAFSSMVAPRGQTKNIKLKPKT